MNNQHMNDGDCPHCRWCGADFTVVSSDSPCPRHPNVCPDSKMDDTCLLGENPNGGTEDGAGRQVRPVQKLHPTQLTTLEPSEELGRQIMALRYDLIAPIIKGMVEEAKRQSESDKEKGRRMLSQLLSEVTEDLGTVHLCVLDIMDLCSKYIEEEKKCGT